MAGTHSRLSPSSSDRWLACPGSVALLADVEDTAGEAARHGTAAHWLIEQLVEAGEADASAWANHVIYVDQKSGNVVEESDATDENGDTCEGFDAFKVDAEMIDAANKWLEFVYGLEADKLFIEMKLDLGGFMPGNSGTSDLVAIKGRTLHVGDFKFGRGVIVNANCNQLKIYGVGALDALSMLYDFDDVVLHIVQPRAFHRDTHETTVEALEAYREYVRERAALTHEPDAPLGYSTKGCLWCPLKNDCTVRAEGVAALVRESFPIVLNPDDRLPDQKPTPATLLSGAEVAVICSASKEVRKWLDDVETTALARIKAGETIPGFKAVIGRGSRDWKDENAVMEALKRKKLKLDDVAPRKLVSPAQAEKLFPGKKAKFLGEYIVRTDGNPVLAPASDKREALTFAKPADAFENLDAQATADEAKHDPTPRSLFDDLDEKPVERTRARTSRKQTEKNDDWLN